MPERVQLQRRRGGRMPPTTVKVDRSTGWGNPLRIAPGYTAACAVADFERWITGKPMLRAATTTKVPPSREEIRGHLADRNLACWCPIGQPCHADVLLRLANAVESDNWMT